MARSHFPVRLSVIIISIAINKDRRATVSIIKLPIFLDSIGTLISAVYH